MHRLSGSATVVAGLSLSSLAWGQSPTAPEHPLSPPPATQPVSAEAVMVEAAPAPAPVAPRESELKFYGHGRLDMAYATSRMAHVQFGFWGQSPDADGPTPDGGDPEVTVYPRWSRFGLDWDAGEVGGPDVSVKAKIEIDFHGGGSESRANPRMRHAYGEFAVGSFSVLAGQTWDLAAPLITGGMENAIFWYGGNLGDRRPQLRLTYAPKLGDSTLVIAGAAAQSGAVDMRDLDGDGEMDGNAWGYPAAQGLTEIKIPIAEGRSARLGVSGHFGGKRIRVGAEDENFQVTAGIAHLELPISVLTLRAEAWLGKNVDDLRGGVGQGIVLNDRDGDGVNDSARAVKANGGWVHLQVDPAAWYTATLGAGIDNPNDRYGAQRTRNVTLFLSQGFKPWKPVLLGATYNLYKTVYRDFEDATVHRLTAYSMVSF